MGLKGRLYTICASAKAEGPAIFNLKPWHSNLNEVVTGKSSGVSVRCVA